MSGREGLGRWDGVSKDAGRMGGRASAGAGAWACLIGAGCSREAERRCAVIVVGIGGSPCREARCFQHSNHLPPRYDPGSLGALHEPLVFEPCVCVCVRVSMRHQQWGSRFSSKSWWIMRKVVGVGHGRCRNSTPPPSSVPLTSTATAAPVLPLHPAEDPPTPHPDQPWWHLAPSPSRPERMGSRGALQTRWLRGSRREPPPPSLCSYPPPVSPVYPPPPTFRPRGVEST